MPWSLYTGQGNKGQCRSDTSTLYMHALTHVNMDKGTQAPRYSVAVAVAVTVVAVAVAVSVVAAAVVVVVVVVSSSSSTVSYTHLKLPTNREV